MEEHVKTGLWKKTSQKGIEYSGGKATICGKEFQIRLFTTNKATEKSPDFQIYFDEIVKQEEPKEDFTTVINDDDLPF